MDGANLLAGLGYGESPRWHDGRLWFANWGTGEIVSVGPEGDSTVEATIPSTIPYSIDWLPDGQLLVVVGQDSMVYRRDPDGTFGPYADLSSVGFGGNEIVVAADGITYVDGIGRQAGDFSAPGLLASVTPDGTVRWVADGIAFGNGMAISPDDTTLVVAESHANRLTAFDIEAGGRLSRRRVWAALGDGVPDGICFDAEGAIWYADVPNQRCVRVREGGEVLDTVQLQSGCFACMLGGSAGKTLFVMAAEWKGMQEMFRPERTGVVVAVEVSTPRAGRP
jgi:sugar lactone lactonase YvrE